MFDADGHIFEKSAEIFEHLDGPYKGRTNLLRSSFFPAGDDWNRTALAVAGDYKEGSNTKRGEEGAPDQWIEVLDGRHQGQAVGNHARTGVQQLAGPEVPPGESQAARYGPDPDRQPC